MTSGASGEHGERSERGGVLLNHGDADGERRLAFIPAEVALRLSTLSALTEVPGTKPPAIGIALADGALVTVLGVGDAGPPSNRQGDWPLPGAKQAVICRLGGVEIAVVGGTVIATGLFEGAPNGVRYRGELATTLDVRALYAEAEAALWSTRAAYARARVSEPPSLRAPIDVGRSISREEPAIEERRPTLLPGPPNDAGGDG